MENQRQAANESPWEDRGSDLTRVLALSDGIFAIAMTLLAIDLGVPDDLSSGRFAEALVELIPKILVFALAFYLVLIKWMAHRRIFRMIQRYDTPLLWLNNVFLLLIAFMPVPSGILGRYPSEPLALAFFGLTQLVTTLVQAVLFQYATSGHRLVDPSLDNDVIHFFRQRNLVQMAALTIFSIVAFLNVTLAFLLLVLAFVGNLVLVNFQRVRHQRPS